MSNANWIAPVKQFADLVLEKGRNLYAHQDNPLIADGIDFKNGCGARVNVAAEVVDGAVLSNPWMCFSIWLIGSQRVLWGRGFRRAIL